MSTWYWLLIVGVAAVLLLAVCAKAFSGDGIDYRKDGEGKVILRDTPAMRADAAMAYDGNIAMEKRGHKLSNGASWNDEWVRTIRAVRRNTENPEWYVQYIIQKRREAGLPELVGLDDLER